MLAPDSNLHATNYLKEHSNTLQNSIRPHTTSYNLIQPFHLVTHSRQQGRWTAYAERLGCEPWCLDRYASFLEHPKSKYDEVWITVRDWEW